MAEPAEYGLTASDVKALRWVIAQVRSGQLNLEQNGQRRSPWGVYFATSIGTHAPDAVQAVQLCDLTWTAISGETPDAVNPSQVTIPTGIRLLLVPGGDECLVIINALICADAP